jgi:hypothetical protein
LIAKDTKKWGWAEAASFIFNLLSEIELQLLFLLMPIQYSQSRIY